jgi:hypothetical protein
VRCGRTRSSDRLTARGEDLVHVHDDDRARFDNARASVDHGHRPPDHCSTHHDNVTDHDHSPHGHHDLLSCSVIEIVFAVDD